jgi:zinc transport system ATP-binding protein
MAEPGAEILVAARDLVVRHGRRAVVDHVDLTVRAGEIVTIIGPNGSGKTTLIRAVLGLVGLDGGTIRRRDRMVVGYVPQSLTIERTLPLTVRRFLALGGRASEDRLAAVLSEMAIGPLLDQPMQALSGGETKRAMLARALLRDPDLLVLDEPMASVDVPGQAEFYERLGDIRTRRRCAILLVSHDLHLVMAATDYVVCLNGHVCCSGRPAMVRAHPEYLALFGADVPGALAAYAHHHDHRHDRANTVPGGADRGNNG